LGHASVLSSLSVPFQLRLPWVGVQLHEIHFICLLPTTIQALFDKRHTHVLPLCPSLGRQRPLLLVQAPCFALPGKVAGSTPAAETAFRVQRNPNSTSVGAVSGGRLTDNRFRKEGEACSVAIAGRWLNRRRKLTEQQPTGRRIKKRLRATRHSDRSDISIRLTSMPADVDQSEAHVAQGMTLALRDLDHYLIGPSCRHLGRYLQCPSVHHSSETASLQPRQSPT
jgi:hypothetical protein